MLLVLGGLPGVGKTTIARGLAVATGGATLEELKQHQPDWAVKDFTCVTAHEVCGRQNGKVQCL